LGATGVLREQKADAMTAKVTCDSCGAVLKVEDTQLGKKGKCPKCGTSILISAEQGEITEPVSLTDADFCSPDEREAEAMSGVAPRVLKAKGSTKRILSVRLGCFSHISDEEDYWSGNVHSVTDRVKPATSDRVRTGH
jgi:predicted Zn finger-like uncharacterized protein